MAYALKLIGVSVTGVLALLAAATRSRDEKMRLTKWGKVLISGITASLIVSVALLLTEQSETDKRDAEARQHLADNVMKQSQLLHQTSLVLRQQEINVAAARETAAHTSAIADRLSRLLGRTEAIQARVSSVAGAQQAIVLDMQRSLEPFRVTAVEFEYVFDYGANDSKFLSFLASVNDYLDHSDEYAKQLGQRQLRVHCPLSPTSILEIPNHSVLMPWFNDANCPVGLEGAGVMIAFYVHQPRRPLVDDGDLVLSALMSFDRGTKPELLDDDLTIANGATVVIDPSQPLRVTAKVLMRKFDTGRNTERLRSFLDLKEGGIRIVPVRFNPDSQPKLVKLRLYTDEALSHYYEARSDGFGGVAHQYWCPYRQLTQGSVSRIPAIAPCNR